MRMRIPSLHEQIRKQVRADLPHGNGVRSAPAEPLLKQPTVQPELPHSQLVVDPVSSQAKADFAFLDEQVMQTKELLANNLMPQTNAQEMALRAAQDAGVVTPGVAPDPFANNQFAPGQTQPLDAGPAPLFPDPMKPPGM